MQAIRALDLAYPSGWRNQLYNNVNLKNWCQYSIQNNYTLCSNFSLRTNNLLLLCSTSKYCSRTCLVTLNKNIYRKCSTSHYSQL